MSTDVLLEDPNGPVVGHFDSRGRFVEDSSGVKVVGRYVDGRFIEDSSGNVIGHFDEKGYFIEDRYIQESAGYSVRESAIDSTGGVNGTGNVTERSVRLSRTSRTQRTDSRLGIGSGMQSHRNQ